MVYAMVPYLGPPRARRFHEKSGLREREGLALGCALTVGVLVGIALGVESATCIFKKL